MNRITTVGAALLLVVGAVAAQTDEAKFNQKQADRLDKFAQLAFDRGFPRQAKLIWLKAIKLYNPDDPAAHKALGHIKSGTAWSPDPRFEYPTTDSGSGKAGAALFKSYEKLKKDLASAHRRQAQAWEKAGRTDKSLHHYAMVLRWVKGDAKAQAALEHREIGAVTGTELEQTLYDRSKMIEKVVTEQSRIDYPVETIEASHPVLERAQVKHVAVKSEHFTLYGDPEEEPQLLQALVWAERALRVVQAAFPAESFPRDPSKWGVDWAFFVSKDTYKQILNANAQSIANLQWRLEHTATCAIPGGQGRTLVVGATGSVKVLFDAAVRNVAQGYAGFATDGFREGIGHTFVGMIFNYNRLFAINLLEQQRTTASEEDRQYSSPDFDVWKDLNLEMAWKSTGGVPAIELPFIDAAKFTNEQRIKAWSFCDYVMRRDPVLLRDMDRLGAEMKSKNQIRPLDLAKKFSESHDVSIAQLDVEWENFWTEASPVLKAIQNNTPPLAAVSRGVEKWLEAFNEARAGRRATLVTWSANLSTRCRDHAVYLKNNKKERGPAAEHRQEVDLGGTHAGSMFAQMAVVSVGAKIGKAKKLFTSWLDIPGYRDALVNNYIRTIGLYTEGDILVMNTVSALGSPDKGRQGYHCYPRDSAVGIPNQVSVSTLGPELTALLEKHGHGDRKVIGYPLTLHFGVAVPGNRKSYQCAVKTSRGDDVPGLVLLDGGNNRRTTAPGMVTFFPLEPLKRGEITARWTWEMDDGPHRLKAKFTTK